MGAFEKLQLIVQPHEKMGLDNPYKSFTVRTGIVEHPSFCKALKRILNLHQRGLSAEVSEGLLLTGQTGSGKTTLLKFYKSHFPARDEVDRKVVPVLLVTTPASPTVKSLAEAILVALGDPAAGKGTADEKTRRIYRYLTECKVELLLIDEFQHFYDSKQVAQAKKVTDWLKNLFNDAKIPVVLAGLPRSVMVIRMNPQLKRRFSSPFYLKPFGFETDDEQKQFRGILKKIHSSLPLPCTDLHEANLARKFYFASLGLFDYVAKIVDRAVQLVGERGAKSLGEEFFEQAFEEEVWRNAPKRLNPFKANSILRPLTKAGEPFEVWDDPDQYESKKTV